MDLNKNDIETCTDIFECMVAEEIRHATQEYDHLGVFTTYVLHGWLSRTEVIKEMQLYWSFRDEVAFIDGIAMKGRKIIIPAFP